MHPEAEALRETLLALIAEYGIEQANRQEEDKKALGMDYDMNCYGAGFSAGALDACNRLANMIAELR